MAVNTGYVAHIAEVKPLDGFKVSILFGNGKTRIIDLESYLWGPMFEPLRDQNLFQQVFVDHGTITWPNGADICSDVLYYDGPPPWAKKFL